MNNFPSESGVHQNAESAGSADALRTILEEEGFNLPLLDSPSHMSLSESTLSFAQRNIWFFEQWNPGTPTYNVGSAFVVDGLLDVGALRKAFGAVVARHDALRTRFDDRGGEIFQVVHADEDVAFEFLDLCDAPVSGSLAAALAAGEKEVRLPFELSRDAPVRVLLVRISGQQHLLVVTAHHLAFDGWSMGVLLNEVSSLYEAFSMGQPAKLLEPQLQYIDYTTWERDRWDQGTAEEQVMYWRRHLAGAPQLMRLPTDRSRPHRQTFAGRTCVRTVSRVLSEAVRQHRGITPYVTLLSAFKVLVSRYSGQADIVVGTPVATRGHTELENVIGLLTNTLVLRTDLSDNPTFGQLQERVRDVVVEALAHKDVPFERLVHELQPVRELSHSPIVQIVFAMQEEQVPHPCLGDAAMTGVYVERGTAKADLTWSIVDGEQLRLEVEYNTDLFDSDTIDRMVDHYLALLECALAESRTRIGDIQFLSPSERQSLTEGNVSAESVPGRCIHELVAEQARLTPESIAVTDGDRHMTYAELEDQADRLAHHIRAAAPDPESVIGVCMERSAEMIVTLLAILKAGAAYLPIDPAYPEDRIRFMLHDAGSRLVVSRSEMRERLPEGPWTLLNLDTVNYTSSVVGSEDDAGVDPESTAYIIYTSGSTGRPKGVVVSHHNVVRLLSTTAHWFNFDHSDVWPLFHSYAFDVSVWEMWSALTSGGRLVIVPYLVSRIPADFYDLLLRERVTVLNQTPSAFRGLVDVDAERRERLDLRVVIFAGEPVDLGSVGRWFALHGDDSPRLVNMYGITETTVHSTYRVLRESDLADETSPIGVPLPDLRVYVLDRWGNLAPIGATGELHVGGPGVTRGYLGRPALTAERFVPDPFSGAAGARLYRSGDLARWRADGELEYHGRNDNQVKVRGFRIETGEIEAAIARYPAVRMAVVTASGKGTGQKRLIAHVVCSREVTTSELRRHLSERLPEYMIPSAFVFMGDLPVNANGKVDRSALPEPEATRPELGSDYVAPRTAVERLMADIWAGVLGIDRVGIQDDFFELGGDSIRSLQVLSLAKEQGITFSLQDLFAAPAISRLAEVAQVGERSKDASGMEPFTLVSQEDRGKIAEFAEDAYPLSVLQAGMVYHMDLDPVNLPYHNVNSFHVRAPFEPELLRRAAADVVARHPILRTAFDFTSYKQPLQVVHRAAELPLTIDDLRHLDEAQQRAALVEVLRQERGRSFDLAKPPFMRFAVHRRTDETFQWTVTEHHAILDGWSLFSTMAEFLNRYLRLLDEPVAHPEPPLRSHFRDFIALEQRMLQSSEAKEYWADKLADYTPARLRRWPSTTLAEQGLEATDTDVAGELHRGIRQWRFTANPQAAHRSLETLVPTDVCDALVRFAAIQDVPFKSVLLAAHLKVIALITGQSDVASGIMANGRPEEVDGSDVRGMFLNVSPLRVDVSHGSWGELVRRVFAAERELLPYRSYPLAQIQWDLGGREVFDHIVLYNRFHILSDLIGGRIEILDDKIDATTEYRAEPTNHTLCTGFLRSPKSSDFLLRLDYYTERLSDVQVENIRDCYLAVFAAMVDPDNDHQTFSPLSEAERHRILVAWNDTERRIADSTVPDMIEAQVARTPDAVAVEAGERTISYREINARANRLAQLLIEKGAGPERSVAVAMPRSIELVVTIVAVLKAGAVYVPIDPEYPKDRIAYIVGDAKPVCIVVADESAQAISSTNAVRIVLDAQETVDRLETFGIQDLTDARRLQPLNHANPAYIIYTSGSTGTPKGVVMTGLALSNLLGWHDQAIPGGPGVKTAHFTSISFDVSVQEILSALVSGRTLTIVPEEARYSSALLAEWLDHHNVTELLAPDLVIQALCGEVADKTGSLPGLRTIIQAGEALTLSDPLQTFVAQQPGRRLANHYGPAETHVVTGMTLPGDTTEWPAVPPIGGLIPNTCGYVLDERLQPAPVGVPGELYIAGVALARGYLNRPDLTSERFLASPFGPPGERMYRSGDLVRWLPDGTLEFLGRADNQVKIRGFRIELGEVESALARHPSVARAAVVIHEHRPGDKRLVAYVVPRSEGEADHKILRRHLADLLPTYMVPAVFLFLDHLPITRNGKLDRTALPDPALRQDLQEDTGTELRTLLDEVVALVWRELLGVPTVRPGDNFFALGGNSLLIAQMSFRLQKTLAVQLPLVKIMRAESLAVLSDEIASIVRDEHGDEMADVLLERPAGAVAEVPEGGRQ